MNMNYQKKKELITKRYESIIELLKEGNQYKNDLREKFKYTERGIRRVLSEISFYYPVIAHSKNKGYRIASDDDLVEAQHTINELLSRCKEIKRKCKPLVAYIKEKENK